MSFRTLVFWVTCIVIGVNLIANAFPWSGFHTLNAMGLAASIVVMWEFGPTLKDAWKARYGKVSPGNLLTLGIVLGWMGFGERMARWYVTDSVPFHDNHSVIALAYTWGMSMAVVSAFLLTSAIAYTNGSWPVERTYRVIGISVVITGILLVLDLVI